MYGCTLTFSYYPKINWTRSSHQRCQNTYSTDENRKCAVSCVSQTAFFLAENATTMTMHCCKLEWLVDQWLTLYIRLHRTRKAFSLPSKVFIVFPLRLSMRRSMYLQRHTHWRSCTDQKNVALIRWQNRACIRSVTFCSWNACHFDAKYCYRARSHQWRAWIFSTTGLSGRFRFNIQSYRKHILTTHNTVIEIPRSKTDSNMKELQLILVQIPLIGQTLRVDISDIHPKDKTTRSKS